MHGIVLDMRKPSTVSLRSITISYGRPVGQNMKYLILGPNERFLGCLLLGAAAWKIEFRDLWIGWQPDVRERNLGLICNNTRFLISKSSLSGLG